MTQCWHQASGAIELYFYGELPRDEHETVRRHLTECPECRRTLEELQVIRAALDARPDIAAPPGGDWSGFMARLDRSIHQPVESATIATLPGGVSRRSIVMVLGTAALLALVTISVLVGMRRGTTARPTDVPASQQVASQAEPVAADTPATPGKDQDVALTELSEQHFERSKLVVLGLATKDPQDSTGVDWDYERELASSLLSDTRLYRQAAEDRGMKSLANVMRDLELVLLQTSMSDTPDPESLAQLQRLIRRRDLITKMDIVKTSGLVP